VFLPIIEVVPRLHHGRFDVRLQNELVKNVLTGRFHPINDGTRMVAGIY
jgi:hypothetical protein